VISIHSETSFVRKSLERAFYYENRGLLQQAQLFYSDLAPYLSELLGSELERVARFYYQQQEYQNSFICSKLAIEKGGNINIVSDIYISSWERLSKPVSELTWLIEQCPVDVWSELHVKIAVIIQRSGLLPKSYGIFLKVLEHLESLIKSNPGAFPLYLRVHLHLIEHEKQWRNIAQCRYLLRKTLYLKLELITFHQEIAYWAILLDEVAGLVTRHDWPSFRENLSGEILWICDVYHSISNKKLSRNHLLRLESHSFENRQLENKRKTLLYMLYTYFRLPLPPTASLEIEDDLLTTLIRAKEFEVYEAKELWKREFRKHADRPEAIRSLWKTHRKSNESRIPLENCKVTFLGGGEKIGGTSILVNINGRYLLLDAGMHLSGQEIYPDYSLLKELGLSLDDVDALLISHAHLDHTGAIPYVHKLNPNLPMFATEPTIRLMKPLLMDVSKRSTTYTELEFVGHDDVEKALWNIQTVELQKNFDVASKSGMPWAVTYFPSGHILGAAAIYLEVDGIRLLFTGDYSVEDQKTVKGIQIPDDLPVDILITESTYGYMPTNASIPREIQEKMFIETVMQTIRKDGNVLIPAFALGRAQEIVCILQEWLQHSDGLPFNLFIDGRVTDICNVYQEYSEKKKFIHPNLYQNFNRAGPRWDFAVQSASHLYTTGRERGGYQFREFLDDYIAQGRNCIVASSGMLADHSASAKYAEYLIDKPENTICFTGYMDEESPGSVLLREGPQGADQKVSINGKRKNINANIESFRLSAHASREDITEFIVKLQPRYVFFMHGEHQKQYSAYESVVNGNVIYPSVIDLLRPLQQHMTLIPACNGITYSLT
jgi:Cft2 family RNA processing exonuclease